MSYTDHYGTYLNEIEKDIDFCRETGRRIVFGYTSNLDIVFQYDSSVLNPLFEKYVAEPPRIRAEDSIGGLDDLARVVAAYMIQGAGCEVDITDYGVCEYLVRHLNGVYGLGGTCAQGAAALAATGMPLIAHISDRCREVCSRMDYPGLYGILGGRQVPMTELATEARPVYHLILQFTRGDTLVIGGETYTVPCSNRLIMDYDTIHKDLQVDSDFRRYLEEHARELIAYNVSGFNGILDAELAGRRLQELDGHYRRVKEENPGCIFYLESAHYLSPQVKHLIYHTMAQYVDILGMNEEELVVHTRECGQEIDIERFPDILRGLELVRERHGVKGIILHTKDYSMYFGDELKGISIEKGLAMGNLMAGTRARTGRYGTLADLRDSLAYPLSGKGLQFAEALEQSGCSGACLVPSRYMEKPKYTIGLGDTFVAGVQLAFVH